MLYNGFYGDTPGKPKVDIRGQKVGRRDTWGLTSGVLTTVMV